MDRTDKKILLELDKNPRSTFKQLGKSARISKEVAQYRFNQLIKRNVLTGFFAFINVSKMGFKTDKILVKYKSVTKDIQKEITEYLRKSKVVAWAGNSEGAWDLVITTISPSSKEFVNFFNNFFGKFGKYFKQKEILIPVDNPIFNDKFLSEGKLVYHKKLDFHLEPIKLDDKDKEILTQISLNSRASFTDIGKKVGLTYWAVSQRYKRLTKEGVILLLKPRIDFRQLGLSYHHLFLEINNEEIRKKIVSYYTQQKDCIMLMNHAGTYSLHLEFVLKKEEMHSVILDLRERFGNDIVGYEPLLIVEEHTLHLLK